jgi:hypothetical protein
MEAVQAPVTPVEAAPAAPEVTEAKAEVVSPAVETAKEQTQQAPKAEARKYKLTVDGQNIEATDEQISQWMKKAQEGETVAERQRILERQVQEYMELLNDPDFYFQHKKLDPYEYAERKVLERLEEAQLTPEQKELRELKKFKEQIESEKKKREEEEQKTAAMRIQQEADAKINQLFLEILDNEGKGVIKTPRHAKVLADNLAAFLDDEATVLTPELAKKAFEKTKMELRKEVSEVARELTPEELVDLLGEDVFNQLLKFDLQKAKKNVPQFAPKGLVSDEVQKPRSKKPMTFEEAMALKMKELNT